MKRQVDVEASSNGRNMNLQNVGPLDTGRIRKGPERIKTPQIT